MLLPLQSCVDTYSINKNTVFFVIIINPVMSILATVEIPSWERQLIEAGATPPKADAIIKDCMRACIIGGHELANVRRSNIETQRGHAIAQAKGGVPPRAGVG